MDGKIAEVTPFPRMGGGDPGYRARALKLTLFPAWAGVILCGWRFGFFRRSFPRVGGGDPIAGALAFSIVFFSPRGRG